MLSNEELCLLASRRDENRNKYLLELFQKNRGLIFKFIQPYIGIRGCEKDDLMQEAFLAVVECADHFDPDRGKFTNLLPFWIKNIVLRASSTDAVRLPEHIKNRIRQYTRLCDDFQKRYGKPPADIYIRMQLGLSQQQIDDLRIIIHQNKMRSLDDLIAEDLTVADSVADDRDIIGNMIDQVDRERASKVLWSEVAALDQLQSEAIKAKFQDNLTVREVADRLHLTKSQASGAIEKGCKRLRRKKKIKQVGETFGYTSRDLYGGGLQSFLYNGSHVEDVVIKMLEKTKWLDTQDKER